MTLEEIDEQYNNSPVTYYDPDDWQLEDDDLDKEWRFEE